MNRTLVLMLLVALAGAAFVAFMFYTKTRAKGSTMELTFAMIKPDAVRAKNSGKIIDMIEHNGFDIVRMEKVEISKDKARTFYAVHKDRPFFNDLVEFISSGPVIVMALGKENGVKAWRDLMGATNPEQAAEGTIRKSFGTNIGNNAVHGSDALETAKTELSLFFPELKK